MKKFPLDCGVEMVNSVNDPGKGIDPSAGGLVWVRRRNGSWWPGRILGADELPENCVPIPRFGTPVKLLGREDASVDWYNLEKSKRIKTFRCGEFNDCIEKAKAAASHSSKKAVKYARREDAIIQALEIENAHHGNKHPDFSTEPDIHDEEHHHVDESPSSFHTSEGSEDLGENLSDSELSNSNQESEDDSAQDLSQSGEESDLVDLAKGGSRWWRTPNDSEDDGTEGVKRMRGLEDLGMGVAPSLKRKRSQVARVHEFLKRKNRRRTLTKVLECTPVVPVPICALSPPNGSSVLEASDSKVSGLESYESKKNNINNNSDSTGVSCENMITSLTEPIQFNNASLRCKQKENEISSMVGIPESDSFQRLFDVPLVTEEKRSTGMSKFVSGAPQKAHTGAGAQSSQSSHVETEHNESGSASSGTAEIHNIGQRIEKGTSKWQLKGKRNSRSRKVDLDNEADTGFPVGSGQNMDFNRVGGTLMTDNYISRVKSRPVSEIQGVESRGWGWNARKGFRAGHLTPELPVPQRQLPYRQSRFTVNPKYESSEFSLRHHITGSGLYEVHVEVKASSRPQRVPYISLMSKLNGQPIIGHPIAIEKLKDGFCNNLIRTAECYSSSSEFEHCLGGDPLNFQGLDMAYKQKPRGRPPRKHGPPRSRRNILLSKKTKKLSSLTGARKNQDKKPVVEKLKGPSIACVPLSIVFSRINAAMNSSTRSAPRLTKSGDT